MMWLGYAGMPRRVLDYPAALGGWHSLATSAHILSIAGILCFIIMLFDSLRKKKTYTIKTFGIGRYNTRLNFYLYEIHRNKYWLHKSLLLNKNNIYKNQNYSYNKVQNYELYESTTFYYTWK
jgi:heme/copper-type cytochrome/quinol oxidase subunit 1